VIETARCRIRRFRADDVDPAHAYLGDPDVMEFVEAPFDRDRTERFIVDAGLPDPPLMYAVESLGSGQLVGHVIFHPWHGVSTWEVGWILRKDSWGRGLASELSLALFDHGFGRLGVDRIVAEADPSNTASIRVMERVGMVRAPELDRDLPVWQIERRS